MRKHDELRNEIIDDAMKALDNIDLDKVAGGSDTQYSDSEYAEIECTCELTNKSVKGTDTCDKFEPASVFEIDGFRHTCGPENCENCVHILWHF